MDDITSFQTFLVELSASNGFLQQFKLGHGKVFLRRLLLNKLESARRAQSTNSAAHEYECSNAAEASVPSIDIASLMKGSAADPETSIEDGTFKVLYSVDAAHDRVMTSIRNELRVVKMDGDRVQSDLDQATSELSKTKTALSTTNAKLEVMQTNLDATKDKLDVANRSLANAQTELSNVEAELASVNCDFGEAKKDHVAALAVLEERLRLSEESLKGQAQQLSKEQREHQEAKSELRVTAALSEKTQASLDLRALAQKDTQSQLFDVLKWGIGTWHFSLAPQRYRSRVEEASSTISNAIGKMDLLSPMDKFHPLLACLLANKDKNVAFVAIPTLCVLEHLACDPVILEEFRHSFDEAIRQLSLHLRERTFKLCLSSLKRHAAVLRKETFQEELESLVSASRLLQDPKFIIRYPFIRAFGYLWSRMASFKRLDAEGVQSLFSGKQLDDVY